MLKHRTLLITGTNKNTGKIENLITRKNFPKDVVLDQVYQELADCVRTNSWFIMHGENTQFVEMFNPKEYSAMSISIQEV